LAHVAFVSKVLGAGSWGRSRDQTRRLTPRRHAETPLDASVDASEDAGDPAAITRDVPDGAFIAREQGEELHREHGGSRQEVLDDRLVRQRPRTDPLEPLQTTVEGRLVVVSRRDAAHDQPVTGCGLWALDLRLWPGTRRLTPKGRVGHFQQPHRTSAGHRRGHVAQ
jgi:hypothetical protein